MQNINGFVSVPVSFAGLQTIDHQPAGRDPLPFPSAAFTARSRRFCGIRSRSRSH